MELTKPNPGRWVQGQSGNLNGRPVGARGRFSQRFIADLSDAWGEHGATALARTAKEYPDRFVGICAHLIPKDVSVSISANATHCARSGRARSSSNSGGNWGRRSFIRAS
jgi:hypothetical protein